MSRSSKKPPFVAPELLKRIEAIRIKLGSSIYDILNANIKYMIVKYNSVFPKYPM